MVFRASCTLALLVSITILFRASTMQEACKFFCRRVDLFHHTDPAGAILVDALQITQFRDMNAVALRRLQDGAAGGCGTFFPVDREV